MKKWIIARKGLMILLVLTLSISVFGCSSNTSVSDVSTEENTTTDEYKNNIDSIEEDDSEPQYDESIQIENNIAYFDMTPEEFVDKYNKSLTDEAYYIANHLTSPKYTTSGVGLQQVQIYLYDVSNYVGGAVYTYVSTNEDNKILELCIGIDINRVSDVNIVDVLYNQLGGMTMVLTKFGQADWKILADNLSKKIANKETKLNTYYRGVALNSYSNENGLYFKISCMPEDVYLNLNM